jgi:hypothetical protein
MYNVRIISLLLFRLETCTTLLLCKIEEYASPNFLQHVSTEYRNNINIKKKKTSGFCRTE